MPPNLDRRIADLEKAAPPAKHRPEGMASEEFMNYVFAQAAGLPEEQLVSELRAWFEVMTTDELTALSAAFEAESRARAATAVHANSRDRCGTAKQGAEHE